MKTAPKMGNIKYTRVKKGINFGFRIHPWWNSFENRIMHRWRCVYSHAGESLSMCWLLMRLAFIFIYQLA